MKCLHLVYICGEKENIVVGTRINLVKLPGPVDLGDVGACENDSDELDESKNEADSDVDPGEGVLYQVPLQHHLQDLDTPVFPDSNVVTPCLNGFVNLQYSFNDCFG